METKLGKIRHARFGRGGYDDAMISFRLLIGGDDWVSIKEYIGGWIYPSKEGLEENPLNYEWTHDTRIKRIGEAAWEVFQLMEKAKVDSFDKLEGAPIKAYLTESGRLIKIEILEEVI